MLGFIRRHPIRTTVLILILAVGIMAGSLLAYVFRPVSERDLKTIAAGMIEFYNQPPPHWNENLPLSLTERDRQHYRYDPATDVHPGYVAVGYYYRRIGIEYQQSFYLQRHHPNDTNDLVWTLTPVKQFWNPLKQRWIYLNGHPITITNGPCQNEDLLFMAQKRADPSFPWEPSQSPTNKP